MSVSRSLRRAIAVTSGIILGIAAMFSLGMRGRSHRYSDVGGAMTGVLDAFVIFAAAATFGTLLTDWLLDGDEALSRRRRITLGVCGVVMLYLFFVANCG